MRWRLRGKENQLLCNYYHWVLCKLPVQERKKEIIMAVNLNFFPTQWWTEKRTNLGGNSWKKYKAKEPESFLLLHWPRWKQPFSNDLCLMADVVVSARLMWDHRCSSWRWKWWRLSEITCHYGLRMIESLRNTVSRSNATWLKLPQLLPDYFVFFVER